MSDPRVAPLLEWAAEEVGCSVDELAKRLSGPRPAFNDTEWLPSEILEAWPLLPLEAKAVSICLAAKIDTIFQDGQSW